MSIATSSLTPSPVACSRVLAARSKCGVDPEFLDNWGRRDGSIPGLRTRTAMRAEQLYPLYSKLESNRSIGISFCLSVWTVDCGCSEPGVYHPCFIPLISIPGESRSQRQLGRFNWPDSPCYFSSFCSSYTPFWPTLLLAWLPNSQFLLRTDLISPFSLSSGILFLSPNCVFGVSSLVFSGPKGPIVST